MSLLELPPRPAPDGQSARQARVVEAALRCYARWGVTKTTFDDIGREAGTSRATVYRFFPGGRDALLLAVVESEVAHFVASVAGAVDRVAGDDLETVLVTAMSTAGRLFSTHPALQFVLRHEPEIVLPRLAFGHLDEVLHAAGDLAPALLGPLLEDEAARRLGEWAARILLSYASCPADGVDIADPASIRRLVRTFILPGILSEGAV